MSFLTPDMNFGDSQNKRTNETELAPSIAKKHLEIFANISSTIIYQICYEICVVLQNEYLKTTGRSPKEEPPLIEDWTKDWYERFSRVLLKETVAMKEVFKQIILSKSKQYTKSGVFEEFYALALIVIRFIEGINWGYSEMLIHH